MDTRGFNRIVLRSVDKTFILLSFMHLYAYVYAFLFGLKIVKYGAIRFELQQSVSL